MKTTVKKLLTLALCLLLLGAVMLPAIAIGGVDGNVTWDYDPETKTLTFSGNGDIEDHIDDFDYEPDDWHIHSAPWSDCYNEAKTLVIEEGVTGVGLWAFRGFSALKNVSLPSSLTKIDTYAFEACTSLEEITIPANVKTFGFACFAGCSALRKVEFLGAPDSIGYSMFISCTSLEEITIPEGVQTIGTDAFWNCTSLKTVTLPKGIRLIYAGAFSPSSIKDVYYGGSEADWNQMQSDSQNDGLLNANIHFLTPTPAENANVCHWCGKVHGGGFDAFIAWIHNLLAKIFGAKF